MAMFYLTGFTSYSSLTQTVYTFAYTDLYNCVDLKHYSDTVVFALYTGYCLNQFTYATAAPSGAVAYYLIFDFSANTVSKYTNVYNFHDGLIAELLSSTVPRVYFAGMLNNFGSMSSSYNGWPVLFSA